MAEAIGPGTLLVCLSDIPEADKQRVSGMSLTVGAIYTCEGIQTSTGAHRALCNCDFGVYLVQRPGPHVDKLTGHTYIKLAYCHKIFRPLNDGDTSLVENEKEIDAIGGIDRTSSPYWKTTKEQV